MLMLGVILCVAVGDVRIDKECTEVLGYFDNDVLI